MWMTSSRHTCSTSLMKLLPRHSKSEECNCNERRRFWLNEPVIECKWTAVERDNACGWAIRIYEKLKTDLKAEQIMTWYCIYTYDTLIDCTGCMVERGCCKKRKLTLAMTSQILDWLKQHQEDINSIDTGEQRTLVYC